MSSAKGNVADEGAAGKGVKGKEAFIAKAAGAVIATGIAWSVYKSLSSRKEEVELIEEYYGSSTREEYTPNSLSSTVIELESDAKEKTDDHEKIDDVKSTTETKSQELESEVSSKSIFFFGQQKKKASKPKTKLNGTYEINKGDTLYGISRKYGVTVEALKVANGISGDDIYAGDKLVIPE
eukprot:c23764_g1_i1 orf=146-688(+)